MTPSTVSSRPPASKICSGHEIPGGLLFLLALVGALTGCTAYVEPAPVAYAPPPEYQPAPPPEAPAYETQEVDSQDSSPVVEITVTSDFYTPLEAYGTWVDIDGYGRCWQPRNVGSSWRPYSSGQWVSTDAGWCWQSSESFGWATYHYGRWNRDPQRGWYWVPQTQWAPAWVSWREGGGYAGWAPLPPQPREGIDIHVEVAPSAYVFVDERHFSEPVRSNTVIINNTTIINNTVIINNTHGTNNLAVSSGPSRANIEKATGRTITPVPVRQIRGKEEAKSGLKPQTTKARAGAAATTNSKPYPQGAAQSRAGETNLHPALTVGAGGAKADADAKMRADANGRNLAVEKAEADAKARQDQKTGAAAEESSEAKRAADAKARADAQARADAEAKAAEKSRSQAQLSEDTREHATVHSPAAAGADIRPIEGRPSAAQSDAKAMADAKAKAKAEAKAKADAAKAKEDEERRSEESKPQQ